MHDYEDFDHHEGLDEWSSMNGHPPDDGQHVGETSLVEYQPTLEVPETFSPDTAFPYAGDPGTDTALWHQQEQPDTCAIASQEFVLESLTGQPFSEAQLTQEAEEHGWYQPGAGTPVNDMNALLTYHGIPSESHTDGTVPDIEQALNSGDKVIVSVDGEELHQWSGDQTLDDLNDTIPGQGADHAVEVTGLVQTADGPMVVLNDPGLPGGGGCMVPVEQFENAWADSGNVMIIAGPTADSSHDELSAGTMREAAR